jgi:hypothetical protein
MSTQQNNSPRRERLGIRLGFKLRSRVLAVIAAILMGASLVFTSNISAHDIDLREARETARDYARSIRNDPGRTYKHYATDCVRAFSGHNHIVRCTIFFQTVQDKEQGKWTCRERIEVYFIPHEERGGGFLGTTYTFKNYIRRTSQRAC